MARLHTVLVGTGRPRFAFLPGLFGRGRNWTQVANGIAEAGFASVLFDLPDHGQSAWTGHFSYPEMARAVAQEIDERLGSAANLILVGHSMGGKVAMLAALNHPELVSCPRRGRHRSRPIGPGPDLHSTGDRDAFTRPGQHHLPHRRR